MSFFRVGDHVRFNPSEQRMKVQGPGIVVSIIRTDSGLTPELFVYKVNFPTGVYTLLGEQLELDPPSAP